jgi:hypothetical protein
MSVANLQLEGLYMVVAALNNALVAKGLMSREEIDLALRVAEETSAGDTSLHQGNGDAVAFPARFLRLANSGASDGDIQPFSELAKLVGQTKVPQVAGQPASMEAAVDPTEVAFYASENGDRWHLATDYVGHTHSWHRGPILEKLPADTNR